MERPFYMDGIRILSMEGYIDIYGANWAGRYIPGCLQSGMGPFKASDGDGSRMLCCGRSSGVRVGGR